MRKSCQADIMSEQAARMHDINLCKNIQLDDQARTDRYQERCRTKAIKILDH